MSSLYLTSFEEQTLQAIGASLHQDDIGWVVPGGLMLDRARELFGSDWGGGGVPQRGTMRYPVLNGAFGRLKNKGVLERFSSTYAAKVGCTWGSWRLTDLGREMIGFPPLGSA